MAWKYQFERGDQFGRLTVVGEGPYRYSARGKARATWKCECRCGRFCYRTSESLVNATERSSCRVCTSRPLIDFGPADHLLGRVPDRKVAAMVPCHRSTVRKRRKDRGIPGISPQSYDWPLAWIQDFQLPYVVRDVLGSVVGGIKLNYAELGSVSPIILRQALLNAGAVKFRRRGKKGKWRRAKPSR